MRIVSNKSCRENQNTLHVQKLFFDYRTVYEITRGKHDRARQATDDNTVRRMRIACCIPYATDAHSGSVRIT